MAKQKPTITRLSDLQPGQLADFFALLAERNKGTTRTGKDFYSCRFRDPYRTVSFMVWSDSDYFDACEKEWHPGMFFKIRATYGGHEQYGPQIEVVKIRPVVNADREEGFSEHDFVERSRFDSDTMFTELRTLVDQQMQNSAARKLVLLLLDRHEEALKVLPASQRHYFPFPGGWLEHTLSVCKNCLWLADRYQKYYSQLTPPLNRDLILAGAVLHELGRVTELEPTKEPGQPVEVTIPGRLLGHLFLGRDLIRETAKECPDVHPEFLQLLEHIVITHLSLPEWGSPRLPMIPEVLILHHADDLDAKLEMYARCLQKDVANGPFTERDPILGKPLLKERQV